MRKVGHMAIYFDEQTATRVKEIMQHQCSALRAAYQAIHKHDLAGNDVNIYVKQNYMDNLNQRYIADACMQAAIISHKNAIFGGKKLWRQFVNGIVTKQQWAEKRNGSLYSRGDKTKKGNPNIRIINDKIYVNDPVKYGLWIEGKVYLPPKFKPRFTCYDVRIKYKNGKFTGTVSWDEQPLIQIPVQPGAVGLDCNPDGIAVSEVDDKGNLVHQHYEKEQRIRFASANKRDNDIRLTAKRVVDYAKERAKPIVVEELKFKQKRTGRKFNRIKSNFIYRKMLDAIKSRAEKEGIPVIDVNPAFTSILGKLKYQKMYSLSVHNAAAMVIARRGMDIKERKTFTVVPDKSASNKLNLEGSGLKHTLTCKAYSWLEDCFLQPKPAGLTAPSLVLDKSIGDSAGEIPASEPLAIAGRWGGVETPW